MWAILLIFVTISLFAIFLHKPQVGLYLMAFLLPATGWSFNIYGFVLPLVDLVALLVLLAFALRTVFFAFFTSTHKQPLRWPLFFPFAVFLLFNLLSAVFSQQPLFSVWYIIRWPLFLYFAYIFLPDNLITRGPTLKRTMIALLASTVVVVASGYLSLYGQDWHNSFYQITSINWWGIYPFGDNHNVIAEFLNVGVFLILGVKILVKSARVKRFLDIFFVLTVLAIILTFSRAAWITLALQGLIYAGYYLRLKNYQAKQLIIAAVILLVLISPLAWKMSQFQQSNASSTDSRWLLTEISWQAFLDKPYLGYGSGEFINLVNNNIRFIAKYGAPIDSHGFLQKILVENGLFGLAAWLFILVYLVKKCYQSLKKYQTANPWLLPLWLAGIGGLFFQFFNTSYYQGKVWLPIALALTATRLLETRYARTAKD
jgi:O-antigen ligase